MVLDPLIVLDTQEVGSRPRLTALVTAFRADRHGLERTASDPKCRNPDATDRFGRWWTLRASV